MKKNERDRKTILVVDDELAPRDSIRLTLRDNYNVLTASGGVECLELMAKNPIDMIVSDIRMPGMNGFDLLKKIREKDKTIPFVFITAYASLETARLAIMSGADDYLVKPFDKNDILNSIGKILQSPSVNEIDRIKNLNDYLLKENKRLEEKIKQFSKGNETVLDKYRYIFGAVNHSLKSELMHIGGMIKHLREFADGSKSNKDEYDIIERSLQYSHLLLRRLLDYIDIGKPTLEKVDLLDVVRKTEVLIRPRLSSTIQLKINIYPDIGEQFVITGTEQLMGVLVELIQNAENALHKEGGTIDLYLEDRNNEVALSVKDNASGIPEELRANLLQKEVKSKGGLGIGLFLCSKVINELGGKLLLKETSEKGTIFTILLPKASDKKES